MFVMLIVMLKLSACKLDNAKNLALKSSMNNFAIVKLVREVRQRS